MGKNINSAEQKNDKLTSFVKKTILKHCENTGFAGIQDDVADVAANIISSFVELPPSETSPRTPSKPPGILESVSMVEGGIGGAKSTKPGNLLLSMQKLFTSVSSGVLTIAGTLSNPWLAPFCAIVLWDSVYSGMTTNLTEREAAILWTMWENRENENCVPHNTLLDKVNNELKIYECTLISQKELEHSLKVLEKISCIKRSRHDESKWILIEDIDVEYS